MQSLKLIALENQLTIAEITKKNKLFILLAGFFITNALVAEFIGTKIFSWEATLGLNPAQLNIFGKPLNFDMTAGVLLWPVVFIMTDLINEYYGKKGVRQLSFIAAGLLVYAFIAIYVSMSLKGSGWWLNSQNGAGITNMENAFNAVFGQGLAIIVGSLVAFLVGQITDAYIFSKVKSKTGGNMIWLRATGSTVVSQLIDSFLVLFIAFNVGIKLGNHPEQAWPIEQVLRIGTLNYIYKFSVAILLLPLLYFVHHLVDRYLGKELSQKMQLQAGLDQD